MPSIGLSVYTVCLFHVRYKYLPTVKCSLFFWKKIDYYEKDIIFIAKMIFDLGKMASENRKISKIVRCNCS